MAPKKCKNLDSLKQEVEMDEHKVPLEDLCLRFGSDSISVRLFFIIIFNFKI
jgi:hypothetical protein